MTRLFGKHAAKQVQFVRAGDRDEHVRILNARLGQGGEVDDVLHVAHVLGIFLSVFGDCFFAIILML